MLRSSIRVGWVVFWSFAVASRTGSIAALMFWSTLARPDPPTCKEDNAERTVLTRAALG